MKMKKKCITALICLTLCLGFAMLVFAVANEDIKSSTITVSVSELKPGYYLCVVWHGDGLLRLFDYTVKADGKLETTVEIGAKLPDGAQVKVGISGANTDATAGSAIPPVVCTVQNASASKPNLPNGSGNTYPGDAGDYGGYDSGLGGSSSGDIVYAISTLQSVTGGLVSVWPSAAFEDSLAVIMVKPDGGYHLESLIVTDTRGNRIQTTSAGANRYTFIMPKSKVKVAASFAPTGTMAKALGNGITFIDVPPSSAYYNAVVWAVERGIIAGTSAMTFSPDVPCTRAQTVTFLWRAAGSPKPQSGANPFTDVSPESAYAEAILWAVEQGITVGTSATTFSPEAIVTRGQIAVFLHRVAGVPAVGGGNPFDDVADDAYYIDAIRWAAERGITVGTSDTAFSPDAPCTRAQIVTFFYRDKAV